jgi:hypothetical protein
VTKTSNPARGLSVTGKTREAVVDFIKNLIERKFTYAERALKKIGDRKFSNDEYKAGYLNALEGMLLSSRSSDERDFYNKGEFSNDNLKKYKDEFKSFRNGMVRSSFDVGYFSAWVDLIQYKSNQIK